MRYLPIIFALFITGCVASGTQYREEPLKPNMARIIVYRPTALLGDKPLKLQMDWAECSLPGNSYIAVNAQDAIEIKASMAKVPGISRLVFKVQDGHRYYVRAGKGIAAASNETNPVGAKDLLAKAEPHDSGPFDLVVVPRHVAETELAHTKGLHCY